MTANAKTCGGFEEFIACYRNVFEAGDAGIYQFRGQRLSAWRLETTLERFSRNSFTLEQYVKMAQCAESTLNSSTAERANEGASATIIKTIADLCGAPSKLALLIELRHMKYPSPLLDWSYCPYVAAFFAYADVETDDVKNNEQVSIYVYRELPGRAKSATLDNDETITILSPIMREGVERHHAQKACYTVSGKDGENAMAFTPHENALSWSPSTDLIWKFILPASERDAVVRMLDEKGINAGNLYGGDEGWAHTLARRQIDR